ncbi:MAG: sulfatase/phosphatase domain-containing protein, partial [Planctomycetota bacterium]|nr:sulfatase/phosphatase domain-containing protein [Planctomycetota bacterium]
VFTSDHGWGMGEKDYLYKNSLWQESTQVPLMIRVPGYKSNGQQCAEPVSLIDLYPTLIDLCGISRDTQKNSKSRVLDGQSLVPLLESPATGKLADSSGALTALYKWAMSYDPGKQSYALRNSDWRYIRYENGKEELYQTSADPHEWTNLAETNNYANKLKELRQQLRERLPKPGTVPPQPPFVPQQSSPRQNKGKGKPGNQKTAEKWKADYFLNHPKADANRDGKLTWPELKAYREKIGDLPTQKKKPSKQP